MIPHDPLAQFASDYIIARVSAHRFVAMRRKSDVIPRGGRREFYVADIGKRGSYEHCLRLIEEDLKS